MATIKVGINDLAELDVMCSKSWSNKKGFEIVGINDLTSTKILAHLLKYDSTQGKFNGTVISTKAI